MTYDRLTTLAVGHLRVATDVEEKPRKSLGHASNFDSTFAPPDTRSHPVMPPIGPLLTQVPRPLIRTVTRCLWVVEAV